MAKNPYNGRPIRQLVDGSQEERKSPIYPNTALERRLLGNRTQPRSYMAGRTPRQNYIARLVVASKAREEQEKTQGRVSEVLAKLTEEGCHIAQKEKPKRLPFDHYLHKLDQD